jgi:hypothetical protein
MTHTITLSDEQFARLEAAARLYQRPVEQVIDDLLAGVVAQAPPISTDERARRWDRFMRLVGSIQHGAPLSNDAIDELIGEEVGETHAAESGDTGAS